MKVLVAQLCLTLCNPMIRQIPLSMEFSRQENWSGLPLPSPGNLPNPGIEPGSPALQVDSSPTEPPGLGEGWVYQEEWNEPEDQVRMRDCCKVERKTRNKIIRKNPKRVLDI